jgi:hypothetical protein
MASALERPLPPDLLAAAARLEESAWPEIVERWSMLTPTGFPIELTVADRDPVLRWTSEVAGPEVAEARRLGLVAARLAASGQLLERSLAESLYAMQEERELAYGAWLGGRSSEAGRSRMKLYAEIPSGVPLDRIPIPEVLRDVVSRAVTGSIPRMLGVEPARERVEIYLRLPGIELNDLRPLMNAAGLVHAISALERHLPGGARRLSGRRLGISVAAGAQSRVEVALFVSARTLFPGATAELAKSIGVGDRLLTGATRLTMVTLGINPESDRVAVRAGITVDRRRWSSDRRRCNPSPS